MAGPLRSKPSLADEETRLGWRMAGLAFTMAAEVAAGALIGWLIDWLASTDRWLLIGAITGIAVGMWSFIKGAMELNRLLSRQERAGIRKIPPPLPPEPDPPPDDENDEDQDENER